MLNSNIVRIRLILEKTNKEEKIWLEDSGVWALTIDGEVYFVDKKSKPILNPTIQMKKEYILKAR